MSLTGLLWILCLFSLPATEAAAADPGGREESVTVTLKDYPMVDPQGRRVRLVTEVIGDRVAVINFIYTDCTTACPVTTAIMKAVHEKLASNGGVRLITLSVNPAVDTPEKLARFAARYGAQGDDWVWLSGDRLQVDELLLRLHAYSADVEEHPSLILVGDARRGRWTPLYGFPPVRRVLALIRHYLQQ